MASILEVDDCRNHSFIQVLPQNPDVFSANEISVEGKN